MRLVVALTGASGVIYGVRLLEELKKLEIESHLILSDWAQKNIRIETDKTPEYVISLATKTYDDANLAASLSSGSFKTAGMVIVPCSMKTLASIANGFDDTLISRAAAVCIKESRRLVVVPRETPLSSIHIANMLKLSESGGIVLPAMPGFYHRPKSLEDILNHLVGKILDQFNIEHHLFKRWGESQI